MEFRQLFTFKKIVELGSFTKAADELGYSQPTITSHIQALEEHLGLKLFDRIGRNIVLTNAGRQLVTYVAQLADIYAQIEDMTEEPQAVNGRLVIGAPETLSIYRIGPILREYRQTYPLVDIILVNDANAPMYERLNKGEVDIAFQLASELEYTDYHVLHLAYESFVLVASPECQIHTAADNPEFLTAESMIYNAKGCIYRTIFEEYLKSKQITIRSSIELWSIEAIKKAVTNSLGISMLPLVTVKSDIEAGRLKVLDLPFNEKQVSAQLIYHKNKWLSRSMQAWIELTQKHAQGWNK